LTENKKIFNEPYKDGLYEIVSYYKWLPDPIGLILKFKSVRSAVEGLYQVFTNYNEMEGIETLEEKERRRIWKMTEGLVEKRERIKASKAIYLMEKILEQK
jgi:hypothetical protein